MAWGGLGRRRWLLAGLALLCFLLPLGAGRAAEFLLSQGVDFHGATLAVTAPEGDGAPRLLEGCMGEMEDIKQYCRFLAMEEDAALNALKAGGDGGAGPAGGFHPGRDAGGTTRTCG